MARSSWRPRCRTSLLGWHSSSALIRQRQPRFPACAALEPSAADSSCHLPWRPPSPSPTGFPGSRLPRCSFASLSRAGGPPSGRVPPLRSVASFLRRLKPLAAADRSCPTGSVSARSLCLLTDCYHRRSRPSSLSRRRPLARQQGRAGSPRRPASCSSWCYYWGSWKQQSC